MSDFTIYLQDNSSVNRRLNFDRVYPSIERAKRRYDQVEEDSSLNGSSHSDNESSLLSCSTC